MLARSNIDPTDLHRDAFIGLTEAVLSDAELGPKAPAIVLSWRIEARRLVARFRPRRFFPDGPQAHFAMHTAQGYIDQGRRRLLGE